MSIQFLYHTNFQIVNNERRIGTHMCPMYQSATRLNDIANFINDLESSSFKSHLIMKYK